MRESSQLDVDESRLCHRWAVTLRSPPAEDAFVHPTSHHSWLLFPKRPTRNRTSRAIEDASVSGPAMQQWRTRCRDRTPGSNELPKSWPRWRRRRHHRRRRAGAQRLRPRASARSCPPFGSRHERLGHRRLEDDGGVGSSASERATAHLLRRLFEDERRKKPAVETRRKRSPTRRLERIRGRAGRPARATSRRRPEKGGGVVIVLGALVAAAAIAAGGFFFIGISVRKLQVAAAPNTAVTVAATSKSTSAPVRACRASRSPIPAPEQGRQQRRRRSEPGRQTVDGGSTARPSGPVATAAMQQRHDARTDGHDRSKLCEHPTGGAGDLAAATCKKAMKKTAAGGAAPAQRRWRGADHASRGQRRATSSPKVKVAGAIAGSVSGAKACLNGDEPMSRATVTFQSRPAP